MKRYRKSDIIVFFGALIILGAGVVFSIPYVKAEPSLEIVNQFVQATSTPASENVTTTFSPPAVLTQIVNLFTGGSSQATSSSPTAPSSTPVVSVPPPPPPPAQPSPAATTTASTAQIKTLPYSVGTFDNSFETGDGWNNWWGDSTEANGVLSIGANASSTGGGVLLTGSNSWTDLTFLATVDWEQGETFGIVAHYIDDNDYLVCQFDEKNIGDMHLRLDEHVNGVVTHLADGDIFNYNEMGGANIPAAIQVSGNEGSCAFDGYVISSLYSSKTIDPSLSHGEVGFTTWDPNLDNSLIVVQNVGITQTIYNLGTNAQQTPE